MVDVFGGSRRFQAPRGPRGPRGIPGTIKDMCAWMPKTILKNLQQNEEVCCFFVADPTKDIKRKGGSITEWITRSDNKFNLTGERPAKSLTELRNERHALVFKNTRYVSDDIMLLPNHPGTYGFTCVTFRTSSDQEQALLSNFDPVSSDWHEITVTSTSLGNWGTENGKPKMFPIQHTCRYWTTLFIEYVATRHQTQFTYIINNDPKTTETFTFDSNQSEMNGCAVGSRYNNTRFFQGEIASIEMYHIKGNPPPQCLKDLVITNQLIT